MAAADDSANKPHDKPPAEAPRSRAMRRAIAVAVLVALALAGAVLGWHLAARASYHASLSRAASLSVRAADATRAARMEPWNAQFVSRELVATEWDRGSRLLSAGDYNGAVDALRIAYRADVGNAELLALFQRAQAVQSAETVKKAHLQHGHEGPGGSLRPQDIER